MLRVVFAGSPECAVPSLEALARSHRIVAVMTNPPAPVGRSSQPQATAVAQAARRLMLEGLLDPSTPILEAPKIDDAARTALADTQPDIMACFAYGRIFGPKTLALFPLGAYNLHPSLLPRWRGCAPVPAAILARDTETGITIQRMALEMDAGDILLQTRRTLNGRETAGTLLAELAEEGAPLFVQALNAVESGTAVFTPQDHTAATVCSMLCKADGQIDWNRSAADIDAQVRAFSPWPGAWTVCGDQTLLLLETAWRECEPGDTPDQAASHPPAPGTVLGVDKNAGILVQTGCGILVLRRLQWRSKKPLDWQSFVNGSRSFLQARLGLG